MPEIFVVFSLQVATFFRQEQGRIGGGVFEASAPGSLEGRKKKEEKERKGKEKKRKKEGRKVKRKKQINQHDE